MLACLPPYGPPMLNITIITITPQRLTLLFLHHYFLIFGEEKQEQIFCLTFLVDRSC